MRAGRTVLVAALFVVSSCGGSGDSDSDGGNEVDETPDETTQEPTEPVTTTEVAETQPTEPVQTDTEPSASGQTETEPPAAVSEADARFKFSAEEQFTFGAPTDDPLIVIAGGTGGDVAVFVTALDAPIGSDRGVTIRDHSTNAYPTRHDRCITFDDGSVGACIDVDGQFQSNDDRAIATVMFENTSPGELALDSPSSSPWEANLYPARTPTADELTGVWYTEGGTIEFRSDRAFLAGGDDLGRWDLGDDGVLAVTFSDLAGDVRVVDHPFLGTVLYYFAGIFRDTTFVNNPEACRQWLQPSAPDTTDCAAGQSADQEATSGDPEGLGVITQAFLAEEYGLEEGETATPLQLEHADCTARRFIDQLGSARAVQLAEISSAVGVGFDSQPDFLPPQFDQDELGVGSFAETFCRPGKPFRWLDDVSWDDDEALIRELNACASEVLLTWEEEWLDVYAEGTREQRRDFNIRVWADMEAQCGDGGANSAASLDSWRAIARSIPTAAETAEEFSWGLPCTEPADLEFVSTPEDVSESWRFTYNGDVLNQVVGARMASSATADQVVRAWGDFVAGCTQILGAIPFDAEPVVVEGASLAYSFGDWSVLVQQDDLLLLIAGPEDWVQSVMPDFGLSLAP